MLTLIVGGSGSGKSEFAENYVEQLCKKRKAECAGSNCTKISGRKIYLATMEPYGEEAEKRIARHHALRAGKGFETVEWYRNLELLPLKNTENGEQPPVILLECLSNLVANELPFTDDFAGEDKRREAILEAMSRMQRGLLHVQNSAAHLVIVSSDVHRDMGLHDSWTQTYQEQLGALHVWLAGRCDEVIEVAAGQPIRWKKSDA